LALLALAACGGGGSAPPVAPAPPTIGQVTPVDRALSVAFTPPAVTGGAPITQFIASCRAGTQEPVTASGSASPITVSGLTNGREYGCTVTARNSAGESAPSAVVTATPFTTPAAPTLGSLLAADTALEAAFSAPADNGGSAIIDYRLACSAAGSTRSISGAASPLRLAGLTNGTAYSCVVTARNAAGEGAASTAQQATPRSVPGSPALTGVVTEVGSLLVVFSPPASDGGAAILRYTAQCAAGGVSRTATGTVSPLVVDGLADGVTHSCTVRAINVAGEGPASNAATGTPRDLALDAQLTAAVDQGTRRATISWRDTFPAGSVYRIEAQSGGGAFTVRATVTGSGGTGTTLSWTSDLTEPLTLRVFAVREGRTDLLLKTSQGTTTVGVAAVSTTAPPAIATSGSEPLSGVVTLSVAGSVVYPLVEWFINASRIGLVTQSAGPGNPVSWDTSRLANGDYLIIARIQTSSTSFTELRRTVRIANATLTVTSQNFGNASTPPADTGLFVVARASSSAGIASVEARIEGATLGTLNAPNCPQCFNPADSYRWRIDTQRYPSGTYTVAVTAVAQDGVRRSVDFTLQVNNPPVVNLETPGNYDIVFGRLVVRGTASSDRPGGVRTSATLGALTVFDSVAGNFEGSLDLTGLPGGEYRLAVRTVDSAGVSMNLTRDIIVTTSEQRRYAPALSLGDNVTLLESDGSHVVYVGSDRLHRLQPLAGGTAVVLVGAENISGLTGWQIDSGRVVAQGRASDCSTVCIYEWDSRGVRRNLSAANPFSVAGGIRCSDQSPISRGNFVMWANWLCDRGSYSIFNRGSGNYQKIDPPSGASFIGNNRFDLLVDGSLAFIWAQMGGSGVNSTFDVFRVGGGSSARLSVPGARNVFPRAGGTRVVWEQSPVGGNPDGSVELIAAPVGGGAVRSVANRVTQWFLTDQLIAWVEVAAGGQSGSTTGRNLRVEMGGSTATISSRPGAILFGATGSQVIYAEDGRLYRWDAGSGARTLLLEAVPMQVWVASGVVVFLPGGGKLYRLALP
jgi:hypothetical protein